MKRVGILTSGGDCQALNATMRGVGKGLYNELGSDVEIYGFEEGYKGLIYNEYRLLTARDFSGILTREVRSLEALVSLLKICAYRMKTDWTR